MKSKNINSIPALEQYEIDANKLVNAKLPNKIWMFIDAVDDQPFDMLDIAQHFGSDATFSQHVLDYLIETKLCKSPKTAHLTHQEWIKQCDNDLLGLQSNITAPITTNSQKIHEAPSELMNSSSLAPNTDQDTDITICASSPEISVIIG